MYLLYTLKVLNFVVLKLFAGTKFRENNQNRENRES